MPKSRRISTNFSKGELSPRIEGRPDLEAYFGGAKTIENWLLLRQGGLARRPGLRFVREVKNSTLDTILLPFEFSVDDAFIIETGNLYHRFFKNQAVILTTPGGVPVEVVTPYLDTEVRRIHFTQSADVLFMFHALHNQRRLSRVTDTSWIGSPIVYRPPPSFERDTDISAGGTLTLSATTGDGIATASSPVFLEGDVGRQIVFGASRATITGFGASAADTTSPNANVRVTVLDDFPDLLPIASGSWLMRLSPQTTLDPNKKEPVGAQVTFGAGVPAFRAADVGKFITVYGGLAKIKTFTSATSIIGELLTVMADTTLADPAAAGAGTWTLEEESWTVANGFPRTGEFHEGRLAQAATRAEPTTWWLSAADDFDNYAIGSVASAAVSYLLASRKVNQIEWLADNGKLFIGTGGAIFQADGGKTDAPIGGDTIPLVKRVATEGVAPVQPVLMNRTLLFLDRSRRKVFSIAFDLASDGFSSFEVTGAAEHIMGEDGVRLGPMAVTYRPDPRAYFVREDGVLVALTFFEAEKVVGFTRLVTDGDFEAVAAIPQPGGGPDQVWVIVRRTVGGQDRRYIEYFDESVTELMHEPDVVTPGPAVPWTLGAATRLNTVFPAASVFVDDLTVYAFHLFDGSTIKPMVYDVSLDGGVTFPTQRATTFSPAGNDDVVSARTILLASNTRRFLVLLNASQAIAYSDTVMTLPTASTWTQVTPPSSVGAPIGFETHPVNPLNVVVATQDGGANLKIDFSVDGGATFTAATTGPGGTVTSPFGYQVFAGGALGEWIFINPNSGLMHRSVDSGANWALVHTIPAGNATLPAVACVFRVSETRMVAVYKGQVATADADKTAWTERDNLTLPAFSPVDVKQGGIGAIASYGSAGGLEILGGATNYATAFNSATTRGAFWRTTDEGTTWVLVNVVGGALVSTNPTTAITAFAARNGRGVIDIWNLGTTHRNTWSVTTSPNVVTPGAAVIGPWTWENLQTDSAVVYSGSPTTVINGLSHLEGRTVDVVTDGAFRGTAVVRFGSLTPDDLVALSIPFTKAEVGLHYDSTLVTMRPAIEGQVIEGLTRSWDKVFLRVLESIGGKINGENIEYPPGALGAVERYTGDRPVIGQGYDLEGRHTVTVTEPYPFCLLAIFGTLTIND